MTFPQVTRMSSPASSFYAWYTLVLLLGIYVNSFLDRSILALLVGPIKSTLHLTDTQMGFLMGPAFAIFYTIGGIPLGWLADRGSRLILVGCGQVFWSIASIGFGLGSNFSQLVTARIAVGVGEASLSPSAYSLITDLFPPHRLGRALSIYGMGIYFGSGLASLLGGYLTGVLALEETYNIPLWGLSYGWQLMFFFIAAPTIPLTLMLLLCREPKRRPSPKESSDTPNQQVSVTDFFRFIWQIKGAFFLHGLGFACLSFKGYGALSWTPEYFIRIHHWTASQIGTWTGIGTIILGPAGILFGGWLGDYYHRRGYSDSKVRACVYTSLLWIPFGIGMPLAPNGDIAFALYLPATFLAATHWGLAPAAIQEMVPATMRGQASALYLFIINLVGIGLGPLALAVVTDYVFQSPNQIHYSLLITTVLGAITGTWLLARSLPHIRHIHSSHQRL